MFGDKRKITGADIFCFFSQLSKKLINDILILYAKTVVVIVGVNKYVFHCTQKIVRGGSITAASLASAYRYDPAIGQYVTRTCMR
jgi:hypothetical protein